MKSCPRLNEMGILNPEQIAKFAVFMVGNTDILRIVYNRKKGSLLPVSRRYKFPQVKKSVMVDSGRRQIDIVYESVPAFREALRELEQLKLSRTKGQDLKALLSEEIKDLEEDIALRAQYIQTLVDKL